MITDISATDLTEEREEATYVLRECALHLEEG